MQISNLPFLKFRILFIIFLSLPTVFWASNGYMINGGDINYPLILENRFNLRFNSWNDFFLLGNDRSVEITTLFFHIPDLIGKYLINLDYKQNQIFSYYIWTLILIISFNFLLKKINESVIFQSFALLVFSLNYYLFFAWKALQYNILSIILFIIILGITIEILKKKIIEKKDVIKIFLTFFFLPTYSIQTPIIYVFFLFLFLFLLIHSLKKFKKKIDYFPIKLFIILVFLSIFSSFYWIINLGNFILTSVFTVGNPLDTFNIDSLLKWCSREITYLSSFLNMSDIGFFGEFNGKYFLTVFKKFYGLFDFFPMIIYLVSLILGFIISINSKNFNIRIFAVFFLKSLVFSSGVRPPFGIIYQFLVNNFPGFFVIRAPWMKFGFILTISSSILIGYFFSELFKKILNSTKYNFYIFNLSGNRLKILISFVFLASYLFHTEYYIKGHHFTDSRNNEIGFPHINKQANYMNIPDYVFETTNFINQDKEFSRILLLPLSNSNNYNWGFGGPTDITTELFLNKGAIFLSYGEGQTFENKEISKVIHKLKNNILKYDANSKLNNLILRDTFKVLGIKYVLYRKDFNNYFIDWKVSNNRLNKNFIEKNKILKKIAEFGDWELYKVSGYINNFITCENEYGIEYSVNYTKLSPDDIKINGLNKNCKVLKLNNSINRNWVIIKSQNILRNFIESTLNFLNPGQNGFSKITKNEFINKWEINENTQNNYRIIFYQQYLKYFGFILVFIAFLLILIIGPKTYKKIL